MAILQIENLPDELYRQIQFLASEKSFTLNEAVIHLLKRSVESDEIIIGQAQVLQRIRSRPRVSPRDFGLMDSTVLIREERNR